MIEDAEEKGLITPALTTLIGATSGNLGIGLTFIAIQNGYKFVAVMPHAYSLEKQILLKYLGADVVLTGAKVIACGDSGSKGRFRIKNNNMSLQRISFWFIKMLS